jgi:PAS domain S-box-containing protein
MSVPTPPYEELLRSLEGQLQQERQARQQAEAQQRAQAEQLRQTEAQLGRLRQAMTQQTQALHESESRHQMLVESASDIMYKTDYRGCFTYTNPIIGRKLGYPPEELLGQPFTKVIHPDYRERISQYYLDVFRNRREATYTEFPILTRSGQEIWIGQNVWLVPDPHHPDRILEVNAMARDITARYRAEQATRRAQSRLEALVGSLQSGVLTVDEHRRVVIANASFRHLFGLDLDESSLLGQHATGLLFEHRDHFTDFEALMRVVSDHFMSQQPLDEYEVRMADGRVLVMDYVPIFSGDQFMGHLWRFQDVTEIRRAQERLRRSEEKYRGIMENLELGFIETDLRGTILRAYDRFCRMTGYTEAELVGQSDDLLLNPEYRPLVTHQTESRVAGTASTYESQLRCKDGRTIWVLVSGGPVFDEAGQVCGTIGIHYDITHRKRLEEALATAKQAAEEAQQRAEQAQQAEKQFLANMSHEIRTPLNAITGMVNLLYDTRPTPEQLEYLEMLNASSTFLLSLITDVLDMSKIEAGRVEVTPKEFDLHGTLRVLQRTFEMKVTGKPVQVEFQIDPAVPMRVLGDELLLNQILMNLLSNAEKFTEQGHIGCRVRPVLAPPGTPAGPLTLEFEVFDTGVGIDPEKHALIFEKFRQVPGQDGMKYKGTGLGLAITRQLIELQGGQIRIDSTPGQGARFIFTLSYARPTDERPGHAAPAEPTAPVELTDLRVLVVEDNPTNQRYITALLSKWQVPHELVSDGQEAVEAAHGQRYDLILMDVQMPRLNGYDATLAIRQVSTLNRQTPIVALTASAMLDQKARAYDVGMNDFLVKPFTPPQLRQVLQAYARRLQGA